MRNLRIYTDHKDIMKWSADRHLSVKQLLFNIKVRRKLDWDVFHIYFDGEGKGKQTRKPKHAGCSCRC